MNHPDIETRISCSSCGDPICTKCMRQAAVGQKCPRCARVPRSARAAGKPIHYVKGGLAGLGAATVGGVVTFLVLGYIRFGTLILMALLGLGIGRAVGWGAQRQTHRRFEIMAVALGVLGGLIAAGVPLTVLAGQAGALVRSPVALLGVALAGYMALRGLRG